MKGDGNCNICGGHSIEVFTALILQKYNSSYFKCEECGFIQTEKAYWLKEAYQSAITELDIGLIYRNIIFSDILEKMLLKNIVDPDGKFIDYGGGYGMFVRLMRDKGFEFYRQDIHCQNIFARHFDVTDIENNQRFVLLTTFEVFEHLEDPVTEIDKMLSFADTIFFSTELLPDNNPTPSTWWYFSPETGQHISFYTFKSLQILADKFNLYFYSNGASLHMFSKALLVGNPFQQPKRRGRLQQMLAILMPGKPIKKKESLLMKDFEFIRQLININNGDLNS